MIDFCGDENAVVLNRYWDEVAAEVFCSAGKVNPDSRKFIVEPGYRSAYLDELAAKMDFSEAPYRHPPLARCLFEYVKRTRCDRTFIDNEISHFEMLKKEEIGRFSISVETAISRKRDIIPYVREYSSFRGFALKPHRFVKQSDFGVVFEISVDLGGNPTLGANLPIKFLIYEVTDPDFVYEATLFDMIVPGFSKYEYCPTPASCVLGICAHVEMFDVLFDMICAGGSGMNQTEGHAHRLAGP